MVLRAAATALLLTLLCCSPAVAADRDRDRMPDSWERRHKVSKPRGDADRDGLRNRAEYRAKTNPRRRDSDRDGLRDGDEIRFGWHPRRPDSDRDGIRDGRENAGVVSRVAGLRVTIELARGGRLTGLLEDPLALSCAPLQEIGLPDVAGPDETEDFWDPEWGETPAGDLDGDIVDEVDEDETPPLARTAQAGDEEEDEEAEDVAADDEPTGDCRAALRAGALVHEATSELGTSGRRLTRLRLVA